jgi:hypothetical protein
MNVWDDALGIRTPAQRKEQELRTTVARMELATGRARRAAEARRVSEAEQLQREAEARRTLDEHARRLARDLERARQAGQPNPWLKPWDPGYVSPDQVRLRNGQGGRPTPAQIASAEPSATEAARRRAFLARGASGSSVGRKPSRARPSRNMDPVRAKRWRAQFEFDPASGEFVNRDYLP